MNPDWTAALADIVATGRRPRRSELDAVRSAAEAAAVNGADLAVLLDLHLAEACAAWGLDAAGSHALRASVAAVLDGHGRAHRHQLLREEALRREFLTDLLGGRGDPGRLAEQAQRFGLTLAQRHVAAVADSCGCVLRVDQLRSLTRKLNTRFEDVELLVTARRGRLVCVMPDGPHIEPVARTLQALSAPPTTHAPHCPAHPQPAASPAEPPAPGGPPLPRRVALGRAHGGVGGVVRSYEEAVAALDHSQRLDLPAGSVLRAADLLVLPVLLRDREALTDLVTSVLGPLVHARGGAQPLLDTLAAYAESRYVAAEAARHLGISVRAVSYRLERIAELTGFDADDSFQRFTLETAALGARLLDWPHTQLPEGD